MTAEEGIRIKLALSGLAATQAGLQRLTRSITAINSAIVGLAGGAVAFAGLNKIRESIGKVIKLGGELNFLKNVGSGAARTMLALREALDDTGGSGEDAGLMIRFMQRNIAEAVQQGGEAARIFDRLNLPLAKLSQMKPGEQLQEIGTALNGIADIGVKKSAALDIFGKSGEQMLAVFGDGEAFDSLSRGAGLFGTVMERNAKVLDEIGDRLHRIGQFGMRFFAGVLDQLPLDDIERAMKKFIDDFDFTAIGQKFGAFVSVAINHWNAGKFDQFLAASIAAGLELGQESWLNFVQFMKSSLTSDAANTIQKFVFDSLVGATKGIAGFMVDMQLLVATALGASLLWLGEQARFVFQSMGATLMMAFEVPINFLGKHLFALLDKAALQMNRIFGTSLSGAGGFNPVKADPSFVRKPTAFGDIFDQAHAAAIGLGAGDKVNGVIDGIADGMRKLLLIQQATTDSTKAETQAREKLKSLIDAQLAARERSTPPPAEDPVKGLGFLNMKQYFLAQELQFKRDLAELEARRGNIEKDFRITEAAKWPLRMQMLQQEKAILEQSIKFFEARSQASNLSQDDRDRARGYAADAQSKLDSTNANIAGLGPDPTSFTQQMQLAFVDLQNQIGTVAQQIARTFKSIIGGAIDSIAGGISGLIKGTKTWGTALREIGTGIVNSIIDSFARMAAEWIAKHILMEAVAWAFGAAMAAVKWFITGEEIAAEEAKTPFLTINAILASVGSYGASAIIGIIALVAAIGVGIAAAAGAFADGGFVSGPGGPRSDSIPAWLSNGEFVMNAEATAAHRPMLEAINNGEDIETAATGGGAVTINAFFDPNEWMNKKLTSGDVDEHFVNLMGKHAHKFRR